MIFPKVNKIHKHPIYRIINVQIKDNTANDFSSIRNEIREKSSRIGTIRERGGLGS